jgi:hypothetical protein
MFYFLITFCNFVSYFIKQVNLFHKKVDILLKRLHLMSISQNFDRIMKSKESIIRNLILWKRQTFKMHKKRK